MFYKKPFSCWVKNNLHLKFKTWMGIGASIVYIERSKCFLSSAHSKFGQGCQKAFSALP